MKASSVLQNISKGMSSLWKRCVNLCYSQVGRNKLSLHELNKGTLVYSQAEGLGSSRRQAIEYAYNNKSKSKKQSPSWSQTWLLPCNRATWVNLWLIHTDVWKKPMQECKTIILQLKINKSKKIERT